MERIKTTPNLEFDVIYADGTHRHVSEGVLFEIENERVVFHNGTDRAEVIVATAEAAAEVLGGMNIPDGVRAEVASNIIRNIYTERSLTPADGYGVKSEERELRKRVEWLKSCINCKIRKECPRHCGKIVHGCDHWTYGDPAQVAHGRWEWDTEDIYRCSNCYEKSHVKEVMGQPAWDYCPNCGAKMDSNPSYTAPADEDKQYSGLVTDG